MIEQLASLLLPIDALLAHADFNPRNNAPPDMVTLFRNMWFLVTLFHFTTSEEKETSAMAWQKPALARIAAKTPPIVIEEAHASIANELEYNSVIRQEYALSVRSWRVVRSVRPNIIICSFRSLGDTVIILLNIFHCGEAKFVIYLQVRSCFS